MLEPRPTPYERAWAVRVLSGIQADILAGFGAKDAAYEPSEAHVERFVAMMRTNQAPSVPVALP